MASSVSHVDVLLYLDLSAARGILLCITKGGSFPFSAMDVVPAETQFAAKVVVIWLLLNIGLGKAS